MTLAVRFVRDLTVGIARHGSFTCTQQPAAFIRDYLSKLNRYPLRYV